MKHNKTIRAIGTNSKSGNFSIGLTIPKILMIEMGWDVGTEVLLEKVGDSIVITKNT